MKPNKNISEVDKRLQDFFKDLKSKFPEVTLGEGYRTASNQENIYWSQRNKSTGALLPGIKDADVATWARGGKSPHNHKKAIDIDNLNEKKFEAEINTLLEKHPSIQWGYYFQKNGKRWPDPRHFQLKNWRDVKLITTVGISFATVLILGILIYFFWKKGFLKRRENAMNL